MKTIRISDGFFYFKKRGVSYSYRTATTSYLCFVPDLEDSEGAGRTRLTPAAKVTRLFFLAMLTKENFKKKSLLKRVTILKYFN